MKSIYYFLLTLFFVTGFVLPGCEDPDDCDCSGVRYFDIMDVDIVHYSNLNWREAINVLDTVSFEDFDGMIIDYEADYHSQILPAESWYFSLMNTANACTCLLGWMGSKEEMITGFALTTLNDFDEEHLAGSSVIDLFDYAGSNNGPEELTLEEFLNSIEGELLENEDIILQIKKAPELNPELRLKVHIELSTGEVYEADSYPIVLLP